MKRLSLLLLLLSTLITSFNNIAYCQIRQQLVCGTNYEINVIPDNATKSFSMKVDQKEVLKAVKINDTSAVKQINDALRAAIDISTCTDQAKVSEFIAFVDKFSKETVRTLKIQKNSLSRRLTIGDYEIQEIINDKYQYSYFLNYIGPSYPIYDKPILFYDGTSQKFTTASLTDSKVKEFIANHIEELLAFIKTRQESTPSSVYLVEGNKSYLIFNATEDNKKLTGTDKIEISEKIANRLNTTETNLTYETPKDKVSTVEAKKAQTSSSKTQDSNLNSFAKKRVSFVAGLGYSAIAMKVYQLPIIDRSNNNVIIERGQSSIVSASFGIVYTPYLWKFSDADNPKGENIAMRLSYAAFFSPISILKTTDGQSVFNPINFGIGAGYKTVAGISFFGCFEFYGITQPKTWFIDSYGGNNKPYEIPGTGGTKNIQQSFDTNDKNIFRTKLMPSFGVKICYTFDIIKAASTASNSAL